MKNAKDNKFLGPITGYFSRHGGVIIVMLAFVIVFTLTTKNFLGKDNVILMLRMAATNCLIAFGVTMILINGCIDLSVAGTYGLCGMAVAIFMINKEMSIPAAIICTILVGVVIGLANGLIVAYTPVPAFIATLGMSYVARGLCYIIGKGQTISVTIDEFNKIGIGSFMGIPYMIFYMLIILVILSLILYRTRFGRYIYARGANINAARFAGIRVPLITIAVYVICGALAGFAGVLSTARLFTASPTLGSGTEIDYIASAVIGGVSFTGGAGTLSGTLLGSMILVIMGNGMNHMGISSYWQQVVKGLLIIGAVMFDQYSKENKKKKIMRAAAQAKN